MLMKDKPGLRGWSGSGRGRTGGSGGTDDPEVVALQVLGRLLAEPERIGGFLAASGLGPAELRASASQPGFATAVLDYVVGDEHLLLAVASELELKPETITHAQLRLSPPPPDV